ncbi:hypothetical protein [Mesorhizobium sp. B2-4-6]|uniref:hypothetical protein n=1 Tax=Mesorhizobium sp. B2-4-6 TaxID=2589943 RepID=UPI00112654E5|nr:hypothetical protein [Mesorhizobium sp. B2-4-6]TPL40688.1 hypothetical protein FJ957_26010 [Mesorhizobium sp. B2-4-6]
MTLRYVRSGASGANNGTSKTDAYTTLAAAMTAAAAGDTIYIASDDSESQASLLKYTSAGTAASGVKVVCVDFSGSTPPVSADIRTTAAITTTSGAVLAFDSSDSFTTYDGIQFTSNSTFNLAWNPRVSLKFRNCALKLSGAGGQGFAATQAGCRTVLENTTLQFGATTGQNILSDGEFFWRDTPSAIAGSTFPTTLFSTPSGYIELDGVDLSALTGTIFGASTNQMMRVRLTDCKINASATIAATPTRYGSIEYARIDSGGTNYKHGKILNSGTESTEIAIVRTGGASDGTTAFAEKIVTTANVSELFPFDSIPIAFWNDTVGSPITVTVEGISGLGAVPNNDDAWLVAQYLGSSSSSRASFASSGKADILASNAALSTSSEAWGGSTTAFKTSVTFTPQQKGPVLLRFMVGKPSFTVYLDPKPTISGVTFAKTHAPRPGIIVNELQGAGASGGLLAHPGLSGGMAA